jgi:hypothetical protein
VYSNYMLLLSKSNLLIEDGKGAVSSDEGLTHPSNIRLQGEQRLLRIDAASGCLYILLGHNRGKLRVKQNSTFVVFVCHRSYVVVHEQVIQIN